MMSNSDTEYSRAMEKKRKRNNDSEEEELEIDVNLPEPPSKKAARKERKAAGKSSQAAEKNGERRASNQDAELTPAIASNLAKAYFNSDNQPQPAKRSEYGIWIGNLPFTATRENVREFLDREGRIQGKDIVRLHMPTNDKDKDRKNPRNNEAFNRGFAYIDFTTKATMESAIGLSEKLLAGRRVLIKDAKSFVGRPQKVEESGKPGKEPSKRVFIGNLGFDVRKEDLVQHFGQAGEVEDIFLATFEDTGKCKGFGWVRFAELEAAEAAVKGYIFKEPSDLGEAEDTAMTDSSEPEEQPKSKKKKKQKWYINRLYGRVLRCEFAEDAQTRYKKRYGKDSNKIHPDRRAIVDTNAPTDPDAHLASLIQDAGAAREKRPDKEQRRDERRKRHEKVREGPRNEGVSQREKGAILAGSGTKISFD